ncbi:glycine cleavage system aminomethyltransferase GcvT [soil metagenome]
MNDYTAALESAALFDISDTGKVLVTGPDAAKFLHNITSNDILNLPVGGGCETYFLDHRAKVLHRVHVARTAAHDFLLTTDPGRGEALFKHLDKFLISEQVELQDVTTQYAMFHLAGPTAKTLLDLPDLEEFQHLERDGLLICRHDSLGVPGYDIVCKAIPDIEAVKGTPATYETLRIEAGTPVYGKDFDDTRFVLELPRAARGISYTKGCFPGQEPIVMSRDRAGFVNRTLLGVKFDGSELPAAGMKLLKDGQEVGTTNSATFSPRLNSTLALAYVRRGFQEPGTELVDSQGRNVKVLGSPPVT